MTAKIIIGSPYCKTSIPTFLGVQNGIPSNALCRIFMQTKRLCVVPTYVQVAYFQGFLKY